MFTLLTDESVSVYYKLILNSNSYLGNVFCCYGQPLLQTTTKLYIFSSNYGTGHTESNGPI